MRKITVIAIRIFLSPLILGSAGVALYGFSFWNEIGVGWPYSAPTISISIGGHEFTRLLTPEPTSYLVLAVWICVWVAVASLLLYAFKVVGRISK
jgi:hypothetical protein